MKNNKIYAGEMTASEFKEKISNGKGVMVIFGSCEQHGYHMPLDTDNILGFELGLRIATLTDLVVLPPINYGQVWSAKNFPGTISLTDDTIKSLVKDIVISLQQQSPRNIVLFSAHNGNISSFKNATRELRDEFDWTNIWYFPINYSEKIISLQESEICPIAPHAGEIETSMLMAVRPDLVNLELSSNEFPINTKSYNHRPMRWSEIIKSGSFGNNNFANAEKGKKVIEIIVSEIVEKMNEILW